MRNQNTTLAKITEVFTLELDNLIKKSVELKNINNFIVQETL